MLWAFDTTTVTKTAEGAIDAACISSAYADGGFCVGITWTGTSVLSPKLWANWVQQYRFNGFVSNKELGGVDDVVDWHTTETTFLTTWTAYRWLPKYEFIVAYYQDEFRFSPETQDALARTYTSADATTYTLGAASAITLLGGMSGLVMTSMAIVSIGLITTF